MPIVSMLWKRLGYEPIAVLLGDEQKWNSHQANKFVLQETRKHARVQFIHGIPGYKDSTIVQTCRVIASAIPWLTDDDYILTSDVDMLPLSKKFFEKQDWNKDFHIFSADAYADITKGLKPPKFPICYLGAKVGLWRSVMKINSLDFQQELQASFKGRMDSWDNDEMYVSHKILTCVDYPRKFQLMVRTWPSSRADRRIDRDAWQFQPNAIDCHCLRPGFKHIPQISQVLSHFFPSDMLYFNTYINEFVRHLKAS
jgi:hypothetical protein